MNSEQPIHRGWYSSRGFRLSYLDSAPGDQDRPVVQFIHGFPDTAAMWLPQMAYLHALGYRCVAADTLGCGESAMAPELSDYNAEKIAADHVALLETLGVRQVDLVGHDWGAVLGWLVAGHYPDRVRKLCAISVGHPMAYARAGLDQKLKGWYILYFLFAGLSEKLLSGLGKLSLRQIFASHPEIELVMTRLSAPGRLTAAVRIYRASLPTVLLKRQPRVQADVLAIHSKDDAFLVQSQVRESGRWVDGHWETKFIDGGHWIPIEQPDFLNHGLKEFLHR